MKSGASCAVGLPFGQKSLHCCSRLVCPILGFMKCLLCAQWSAGCQDQELGVGVRCTCVQVLRQPPTGCADLDKLFLHIIVLPLITETIEAIMAMKWQRIHAVILNRGFLMVIPTLSLALLPPSS